MVVEKGRKQPEMLSRGYPPRALDFTATQPSTFQLPDLSRLKTPVPCGLRGKRLAIALQTVF